MASTTFDSHQSNFLMLTAVGNDEAAMRGMQRILRAAQRAGFTNVSFAGLSLSSARAQPGRMRATDAATKAPAKEPTPSNASRPAKAPARKGPAQRARMAQRKHRDEQASPLASVPEDSSEAHAAKPPGSAHVLPSPAFDRTAAEKRWRDMGGAPIRAICAMEHDSPELTGRKHDVPRPTGGSPPRSKRAGAGSDAPLPPSELFNTMDPLDLDRETKSQIAAHCLANLRPGESLGNSITRHGYRRAFPLTEHGMFHDTV